MRRLLCLGFLPVLHACSDGSEPSRGRDGPAALFADRARELGLDFDFDRARDGAYFMPDSLAAGCAFLDFDRDGRLDVYLVNGYRAPGGGLSHPLGANRLYRQNEKGRFVDVTAASGTGHQGYGMGVCVGDYDGDGYDDIYVTCYGPDVLLRNEGDGSFSDVTAQVGLGDPRWGSSAGFFDYDADGRLDLFVTNYLDYDMDLVARDRGGRAEYTGPSCCAGVADILYHNEGGVFRDVSAETGIAAARGKGLGVCFGDLDGDGRTDVFVANDSERNRAWIQTPERTFVDRAGRMGLAFNEYGAAEAGMGVAHADLDGDLDLDLFLTHLGQETNTFYAHLGGGSYRDESASSGLGPPSLDLTGFGTDALDYDLDGDLDLVFVSGRVMRAAPRPGARLGAHWNPYAEENLLLTNDGEGRFSNAALGCGSVCSGVEVSRGLARGDFDNDGDDDLLVTTAHGAVHLHENLVQGNWIGMRVLQGEPPADALGALVTLETGGRALLRQVTRTASYLSSRDPRVLFGLGSASAVDAIRVQWPDGVSERYEGLETGRYHELRRGQGQR